ncbi:c-type cytochrome [Acetobacter senegalensis]|uniref:c-type cytochrome n=1 Tax=Acetobacter senegalensis TaxID=446692 RepID=UPI00264CC39B|nr:cystathionine beta-lyase [Acetobacter senegalensis]MDN7350387.1 cystathionine beta-lyase [Acetobacter senegalensis]
MPRIPFHKMAAACRFLPAKGKKWLAGAAFAALMWEGNPCVSDAALLDHATTNYLTHCGGCHGIEGASPRTFVPLLRDHVGTFDCSAEGRAYLVRVPGVSMSLIRDDQELADVMNFVLFRLGRSSTPAGARPFTAEEVHTLRAQPLTTTDLLKLRAEVLSRAAAQCPR